MAEQPLTKSVNGDGGGSGGGGCEIRDIGLDDVDSDEHCAANSTKNPTSIFAKDGCWYRTESFACKRWHLQHGTFRLFVALLVVIFLLLSTVVVLGLTWPYEPHSKQFPICNSAACLTASAQIRESMDDSTAPCTDFWQWACGGWFHKNSLPPDEAIWNEDQKLAYKEHIRIREVIETLNASLPTTSVEWKLKNLYGACMDLDSVNVDDARPLLDIISELGGWYVLRKWERDSFDFNTVLQSLHVRYGVTPFFRIIVMPDPYDSSRQMIRIVPSGLGLPDREYYDNNDDYDISGPYKELIREICMNLGSEGHDAKKFSTDIYNYEKRLAEITPSLHSLENPVQSSVHVRISELQITIRAIPFLDILSAMFPGSNITEDTEVSVASLDYLSHVSIIISTTDSTVLNGYLMWTLVRNYVPYLSTLYTTPLHDFEHHLLGTTQAAPRWYFCTKLIRRFMPLAVTFYLNHDKVLELETIGWPMNGVHPLVKDIFSRLVDAAKRHLKSRYAHVSSQRVHLLNKLKILRLRFGLPSYVTQQYLKQHYSVLRVLKSNLFKSVLLAVDFKRRIDAQRLETPYMTADEFQNRDIEGSIDVTYLPPNNAVIVPLALLRKPQFDDQYPMSVILGRIGVKIAKAIAAAILPYGSYWTNDKLLSPFHQIVSLAQQDFEALYTACIPEGYWMYGKTHAAKVTHEPFQKSHWLLSSNITAIDLMRHLIAVQITQEVLEHYIQNETHIHQPAFENFEDVDLFLLSHIQSQCSVSTTAYQRLALLTRFHITEYSRLKLLWQQLSIFHRRMGCHFKDFNRKCEKQLL